MLELPYALSALCALTAAFLGWRYGHTLYQRGVRLTGQIRVRDCPLIPVVLGLFLVAHILTSTVTGNPVVGWALPVWLEYHLTVLLWAMKVAFAAFPLSAIGTVSVLEKHRFRYPLLLFCGVVVVSIDTLIRVSVQPYLGEITHRVSDGVILQSTPSTCAAASAANIARHFGIDVDEAHMVKLLGTTWAGTSPAQLVYGFEALGLTAIKAYSQSRDIREIRPPAILFVPVGEEPDAHAVAYMGTRPGGYAIWDPSSGAQLKSMEQIQARWGGRAIEVEANSAGRVEQDPRRVI